MTEEEKVEAIRLQLLKDAEEAMSEMNFVKEMIIIAKELNTTIDDVLNWPWKRYEVVAEALREIYQEQKQQMEIEQLKTKTFR